MHNSQFIVDIQIICVLCFLSIAILSEINFSFVYSIDSDTEQLKIRYTHWQHHMT